MKVNSKTESQSSVAQVPVFVTNAFPVSFERISIEGDIDLIALLNNYQASLSVVQENVEDLIDLRKKLGAIQRPNGFHSVSCEDLVKLGEWTRMLLENSSKEQILRKIFEVRDDVLGIYKYFDYTKTRLHYQPRHELSDRSINRAKIELYWAVIGLVSKLTGLTIEDLSVVTLTHELSHAYTQLGADIEGRRWWVPAFRDADISVIEGLAQYYTHRVLQRLEPRYPTAFQAYEKLMKFQTEPYSAHIKWSDNGFVPEAIRLAMIEFRRSQSNSLWQFNEFLKKANNRLRKN